MKKRIKQLRYQRVKLTGPKSSTRRIVKRIIFVGKSDVAGAIEIFRQLGYRKNDEGEKLMDNKTQRIVYKHIIDNNLTLKLDKNILKSMLILSR